ncbi:PQQ-dependent sugar dehydrogenase [Catenuloplanes atrovinosus]|uniref:Glucose/arabinose dehydrogenase n=1 Tax=Catenuloplanes atrovinosus TaxID=137266 RepID=A0AAE4CC12_9ACTN|nr:PQQ-dependent sugar dehydrogenase [Catenuloplanes atrovinosus]MDR7277499.1 glucose/arabinose dehydrogenase [Catenuloplanes atrovinosus]
MRSARRILSVVLAAVTAAGPIAVHDHHAPPAEGRALPAAAAAVPTGFREQTVFTGLDQPMNIEFAPDGRVFVAEKAGRIKVFDSLADPTPAVFADLRANVHNLHDRGLLGLALHPDFPAVPHVYVLYAYDAPPGRTAPYWNDSCAGVGGNAGGRCVVTSRLSRLDASGAETVLIQDWCQQYPSHSTGDLHFGADGMLYASAGDGANYGVVDYGQLGSPANPCADAPGGTMAPPGAEGGALRSQDVRTLADPTGLDGTLVRLDPATGAGAGGNALAASPDPNARRIVAYGLRNPYRFAIRPGTNEVWLGDVGWNAWEEINRVTDPGTGPVNFGWPCFEGAARQGGYDGANLTMCESLYTSGGQTAPFYAYHHDAAVVSGETCPTGGSSVSGAAFYPATGGDYPAAYRGALFFSDYTRDCVWAMLPATPGGAPDPASRRTFVAPAANPVDLAIGPGGDLYYADAAGTVRRIRYFEGNQPPSAVAFASPTSGAAPLTVTFDATGSSDPDPSDAGLLRYAWDFTDDGTVDATTPTASYTYPDGGPYTARLTVSDSLDAHDTVTLAISSGNTPPEPVIDTPSGSPTFAVGETITFTGRATDAQQGTLPASALRWRLLQHHCYTPQSCHVHVAQEWNGVAGEAFPAPDHDYPSYLELELTATDAGGLSVVTTRRLEPRTVDLTFVTSPPGLQVTVNSTVRTTPFTTTVIQGSANTVSAVTPQAGHAFSAWSHGAGQTHVITAPAAPATYTATYVKQRLPRSGLKIRSVSTQETVDETAPATRVLDGHPGTYWHTEWGAFLARYPHEIQLDLGGSYKVTDVYYLPRQNLSHGRIANYEIYVSADGTNWGTPVATGTWPDTTAEQTVTFPAKTGRYVRIRALSEVAGRAWASVAELNVGGAPG